MKSLYQYVFEQSEDSIRYRLAKHVWNYKMRSGNAGKNKRLIHNDMDKYNIKPTNDSSTNRRGLIRWYKDSFPPLPDNKDLIIKYKDWHIEELTGQTELQGLHPDWDIIDKYIMDHPKKRHDILVVFECSNKKPYNACSFQLNYMRLYDKWCDFGRASGGICPDAYAEQYPYMADEWDHSKEGEYMGWVYRELSKVAFKEFMEAWKYKYVIVVIQGNIPRQFLTQIKEQNLWGLGDKMELVIDDDFLEEIKKKYRSTFGEKTGLITTRMLQFQETKLAINKAIRKAVQRLGGSSEDIKELEEIEKIIEKGAKSDDSITQALHSAGFCNKPSYSEYPYGPKGDDFVSPDRERAKKKNESILETPHNMILEMSQHDFESKLHKLEKELDELDVEKVKGQTIVNDMGDEIDLYHRPDDLFKKYEWAWPCMKLLYWMNGKKFDSGYIKDYRALMKFMENQKNWGVIDKYFFYYKPLTEKLGWDEKDVWNKAIRIHFIEDLKANKDEKLKILKKHGIFEQ